MNNQSLDYLVVCYDYKHAVELFKKATRVLHDDIQRVDRLNKRVFFSDGSFRFVGKLEYFERHLSSLRLRELDAGRVEAVLDKYEKANKEKGNEIREID